MKGLELARQYYLAHREALLAPYPEHAGRIAAGLVGPGSECFGFDDELSQDHDFGPGFCLWLTEADFAQIGAALQADYDALPTDFGGFSARRSNARSGKRVGVFSIPAFYGRYLGAPQLPVSEADWLQIPEDLLATAVNGVVFSDPLGAFTRVREALLAYYPDGIARAKLATAVASMAQSGQYNLPRALRRGDEVTAMLTQAEFIRHACSLVLVLNRRYAPFYKWLHRSIAGLPVLGRLHGKLAQLGRTLPGAQACAMVEEICADVLLELVSQGYTRMGRSFLEDHVDNILQARR